MPFELLEPYETLKQKKLVGLEESKAGQGNQNKRAREKSRLERSSGQIVCNL